MTTSEFTQTLVPLLEDLPLLEVLAPPGLLSASWGVTPWLLLALQCFALAPTVATAAHLALFRQ